MGGRWGCVRLCVWGGTGHMLMCSVLVVWVREGVSPAAPWHAEAWYARALSLNARSLVHLARYCLHPASGSVWNLALAISHVPRLACGPKLCLMCLSPGMSANRRPVSYKAAHDTYNTVHIVDVSNFHCICCTGFV